MKKIWSLLHQRIVWTIGAAVLAGVAVPAIVGLVLKALGLLHGASLHTWLLDVGHWTVKGRSQRFSGQWRQRWG